MAPSPSMLGGCEPSTINESGDIVSNWDRKEYVNCQNKLRESGEYPKAPWAKAEKVQGVEIETITIPDSDLSVRIYTPASERFDSTTSAVVYFHGGGGVMGSASSADAFLSNVAGSLNLPAISVEYRLGPEHSFPSGHDDARSAYDWAATAAGLSAYLSKKLSKTISVDRLVLGGTSSGGNLALSTANSVVKSQYEGQDAISRASLGGAVVGSPVCDARSVPSSRYPEWNEVGNYTMSEETVTWLHQHHASKMSDFDDPRFSVVLEDPSILSKIPYLTIATAEMDPLKGEAKAYADWVEEVGGSQGNVKRLELAGAPHYWQGLHSIMDASRVGNTWLLQRIGEAAGVSQALLNNITVESLYPKSVMSIE